MLIKGYTLILLHVWGQDLAHTELIIISTQFLTTAYDKLYAPLNQSQRCFVGCCIEIAEVEGISWEFLHCLFTSLFYFLCLNKKLEGSLRSRLSSSLLLFMQAQMQY